jgi:hypothetical protein
VLNADANVDAFVVDDADALVDAGAKSHMHMREQIAYSSCGMGLRLWFEVWRGTGCEILRGKWQILRRGGKYYGVQNIT